jgi:hypothetical protein
MGHMMSCYRVNSPESTAKSIFTFIQHIQKDVGKEYVCVSVMCGHRIMRIHFDADRTHIMLLTMSTRDHRRQFTVWTNNAFNDSLQTHIKRMLFFSSTYQVVIYVKSAKLKELLEKHTASYARCQVHQICKHG